MPDRIRLRAWIAKAPVPRSFALFAAALLFGAAAVSVLFCLRISGRLMASLPGIADPLLDTLLVLVCMPAVLSFCLLAEQLLIEIFDR